MHFKTTKHVFLLLWLIIAAVPVLAQKNKKSPKGKNQINILKRGYNDVVTRNNYYFNSQIIYKDMLTKYKQSRQIDYDDLLPFYFHDWSADFSAYNAELETIIKKTSIVSQIRDESRWNDDVYLMLGKARYLQKDYNNAFETFRFIVTTMEEDLAKNKSKYNQKERYKYLKKKKKELEKKNNAKQKALELKNKLKEQFAREQAKAKEKEMAQTAKERQKALEKKIKLKKKAIKKKSKGKQVKKDYNTGKATPQETKEPEIKEEKKKEPEPQKKPDRTIDDYKNVIVKNLDYKENDQQGVASDTLSEKEKALLEKLTLWEKLKHKKSRPEAIVWMAKAAIQRGDMAVAKNMILYGQEMRKLTKQQLKELYLAESYYYIHRNSFDLAIEPLMIALEWCKKGEKIWYLYILSQYYEKLNMPEDASLILEKAVEIRGDYQTRMYSRINKARLDIKNNIGNADEIIADLNKMGKKNNNKPYRSDIYYTLAEIYQDRNQIPEATDAFKKAIANSASNPKKRTLSFIELSNLYYAQDNYLQASAFLDSALSANDPVIAKKLNYYQTRQNGLKVLAESVANLEINDSLMVLSTLSDEELANLMKVAEKEEKKQKRKERFIPQSGGETADFNPLMQSNQNMFVSASKDWYFYNNELKTRGFSEFKSIWGNRTLQDNWRRTTVSFERPVEIETEAKKKDVGQQDTQANTGPSLFSKIPRTKKEKDSIRMENVVLYYNMGVAFMQNLEDRPKAIEYFEKALSPGFEYEMIPETYYALYLLYKDVPNITKSNFYKEQLSSKYPNHIITRNLNLPVYTKKDSTYVDKIEKLYASTFSMFERGEYENVLNMYRDVHKNHGENLMTPRFKFLQALSYGHLDSLETLKKILNEIVTRYPNHEVRPKASEYLAVLNQEKINFLDDAVSNQKEDKKKKTSEAATSLYKPDDENTSLFGMVLINNNQLNVQEIMNKLKEFNDKYFKENDYKVSNAFLSVKEPLLLIKRFQNKNDGIKYYNKLLDNKAETFGKFNVDALEVYLISQNNFKELFGSKDINLYREFFISNYLK